MNTGKYNLQNLKTALSNFDAMRGILSHFGTSLNAAYYSLHGPSGTWVMEEDWDNLLILDGCRFDMFADQWEGSGQLQSRRSRASESRGFIEENFIGRELHDTIYVTANPHATDIPDGTFFLLKNVLKTRWDEQLETVPPKALVDELSDLQERYPNKRLIGHFMQPHFPFIGERGRQFEQAGISESKESGSESNVWRKLQYGLDDIFVEEVWEAYRENLDIALEEVYDLVETLNGRIVVSADHGNLVGDRERPVPVQGFGHPPNVYVPELIIVPWHVIDSEERREIVPESPISSDSLHDDVVNERLQALGYK